MKLLHEILSFSVMDALISINLFLIFLWALLSTIFSYQLHKGNEDYYGRLGKRLEAIKIAKLNYINAIRNSSLFPVHIKSLKFNLNPLSLDRM